MKVFKIMLMMLCAILPLGCGGNAASAGYTTITMDEAAKVFATKGDYIILDVRTADEYKDGHIPGAVNLANEDINENTVKSVLPQKEQRIYVYCRSGRRSQQAAEKLVAMKYTNVVNIGGITSWKGAIEK